MARIFPDMHMANVSELRQGCVSLSRWIRATQSSHDGADVAVAVDAATAYSPYIPGAIRYSVNSVPEVLDELESRAYRGLANLVEYSGLVRVSAPSTPLPGNDDIHNPCHIVLTNRLGKQCMAACGPAAGPQCGMPSAVQVPPVGPVRGGVHTALTSLGAPELVRRLTALLDRAGPHLLQDLRCAPAGGQPHHHRPGAAPGLPRRRILRPQRPAQGRVRPVIPSSGKCLVSAWLCIAQLHPAVCQTSDVPVNMLSGPAAPQACRQSQTAREFHP